MGHSDAYIEANFVLFGNSGPGTLFDRKNFCFPPSDIALVLYWG